MTNPDTAAAWWLRGACKDHEDPDLWFSTSTVCPDTVAAKQICGGCPVRMQCAQDAYDTGEHHAIRGGFHTRAHRDRQKLREFIGIARPSTVRDMPLPSDPVNVMCPCGTEFETTRRTVATRCKPCRDDLVPVEPVRARIEQVYAQLGSYPAVATELGLGREQVRRILVDGYSHVKRTTAEKVLGIEIAKAS